MLDRSAARFIISELMRYAIGLDVTLSNHKKVAGTTFLLVILAFSVVSVSFGLQSSSAISSSGMISYWPRVDITVNASKVIGVNTLSLGFQLDWYHWKTFIDRPVQRQLAQEAGFGLIRVFDFRPTNPRLMPCTYWDESTKTGTWNWANADSLTQKIFEIGAEPLFCLGYARSNIQNYIPPGMAVNSTSQLPYPDSYAAYAAEWVRHFKQLGWPVRFYQIMNEPFAYFGWNAENLTRLGYYVEFWNTVATAMRQENPNILLSCDTITHKRVLDYWITYGEDIDFLDFHKYDADTIGQYSDAEMFRRAEQRFFETSPTLYGVNEARQRWYNGHGKWLPVINSESNFNSAWETGTDPKIQQMTGAVWLALVLRTGVLKGLNYSVYFEFSSSKSWETANRQSGGIGFGMINEDDNRPWYPYFVNQFFGNNLGAGDTIWETTSSSDELRVLAWTHERRLNILVISRVNESRTIHLSGVEGNLTFFMIDGTIPWDNPSVQTGTIDATQPITTNGYSVMLLQSS
jgi:hypothetical protein